MKQFLSCDWGTSSFRLKLVEVPSLKTVAELQTAQGIAATNSSWLKQGNGQDRFSFFASIIASAIETIETKINGSLTGVPVILSGMASSSLGMIQLPYKEMPFRTDGSDLNVEHVKSSKDFDHDVFIISGVCSTDDVMRGEETQLVGAVEGDSNVDTMYILPGTHSKHIAVKDGFAYKFETYMTGEIFSLLSKNSMLSESIADALQTTAGFDSENFSAGVSNSSKSNLLNQLFHVRSRFLLDKKAPEQNRSYLSGLLIGNELQRFSLTKSEKIVIVSSAMGEYYNNALQVLGIGTPVSVIDDRDVAIRGQLRVISREEIRK